MPLVGYLCEKTDEKVSFTDCLTCAETKFPCQFTSAILRGMAGQQEERKLAGISVTMCTGCLRASYYAVATEYFQYPRKLFVAYRGTIGHLMVEQGRGPGKICEVRFARQLDGVTLTGKPDEITPSRALLVDFKTKHEVPLEVSTEYQEQLNGYRMILEDCEVLVPNPNHPELKEGDHVSYDINILGLQFITMRAVAKLRVPLMDRNEVRDMFTGRAECIQKAREGGPLPPRGQNINTSRLCQDWCPYYQLCLIS